MMIAILGGGESGIGAACLAKKNEMHCFLSDKGRLADEYRNELIELGVDFEEGQHSFDRLIQADTIVKSPGIPGSADIVKRLKNAGKRVISEVEWAFEHSQAPWIAITGTNGKTTTTALCAHVLQSKYKGVKAVGNIGISVSRFIASASPELVVCEVSSFQLEDVHRFRPVIGVILNITPDHLDRYPDMQAYADAKLMMTKAMQEDDDLYYIDERFLDRQVMKHDIRARTHPLSPRNAGNGWIRINDEIWRYDNAALRGSHNGENVLVVAHIALQMGLDKDIILESLECFVNHPHRMEVVAKIDGVTYINDSKATNVEAAARALAAFDRGVIWIVGGKDKGNDYSQVHDLVNDRVKSIIALGADNGPVEKAFGDNERFLASTHDMKAALRVARGHAEDGDVVLLSPACASFDLYKNYEKRGDHFRSIVNTWKKDNE